MKTYLDMDEVLRHCRRYIGQEYDEPYLVSAVPEEVIRSLPPADVVPVVRCRDCKYRAEDCFCTGRGWPMQLVADDGFCEKGKPKDGGKHE